MKKEGLTWDLSQIIKSEEEFFKTIKEIETSLPNFDLIFKRLSNKLNFPASAAVKV